MVMPRELGFRRVNERLQVGPALSAAARETEAPAGRRVAQAARRQTGVARASFLICAPSGSLGGQWMASKRLERSRSDGVGQPNGSAKHGQCRLRQSRASAGL